MNECKDCRKFKDCHVDVGYCIIQFATVNGHNAACEDFIPFNFHKVRDESINAISARFRKHVERLHKIEFVIDRLNEILEEEKSRE